MTRLAVQVCLAVTLTAHTLTLDRTNGFRVGVQLCSCATRDIKR